VFFGKRKKLNVKKNGVHMCLYVSMGFAEAKDMLIVNGTPEKSIVSSKDATSNDKVLSSQVEQARCRII
jgi:hypothetical protein